MDTTLNAGEPQGLKPASFVVLIGTTEVVPYPVVLSRWTTTRLHDHVLGYPDG